MMLFNIFFIIFMVFGLCDYVVEYWQMLFEVKFQVVGYKVVLVLLLEVDWLSCVVWVVVLDKVIIVIDGLVILVVYSVGVMIIVYWVKWYVCKICGVLLVILVDFEMQLLLGYFMQDVLQKNGWLFCLWCLLQFLSIVVVSWNDLLVLFECVIVMVVDWGSCLVDLGDVGYLNFVVGFGFWFMVEVLIYEFV